MISLNNEPINVTIFPDKTSQVWKLPLSGVIKYEVRWDFESENELSHIIQLGSLLNKKTKPSLYIPYLPYARQDKEISNSTTFALRPILKILRDLFSLKVYDPHNYLLFNNNEIIRPIEEIKASLKYFRPDTICFPDKGAKDRYPFLEILDSCTLDKTRDQSTGEITGLELKEGSIGEKVLIIDDICDGGKTFIESSKLLKNLGAKTVGLYVSHGIFSKGLGVLFEHIDKIYTTNSICKKNPFGYPESITIWGI